MQLALGKGRSLSQESFVPFPFSGLTRHYGEEFVRISEFMLTPRNLFICTSSKN